MAQKLAPGTFCVFPIKASSEAGLSPPEVVLLLHLWDYANSNNVCWPSIDTLAEASGLHRTTIMRSLPVLEQKRFIRRRRQPRKAGGFHYVYDVLIPGTSKVAQNSPQVAQDDPSEVAESDPNNTHYEPNPMKKKGNPAGIVVVSDPKE